MTEPTETRYRVNGVELCVFDWPGDGRPIVFAHATGFHGRCWDEVVRALPGRRAIAIDMRGHGRSTKTPPPYEWNTFGYDVAELGRQLGLRDAIGVGHSMGGHSVTLAASLEPGLFAGLLLVDPVILSRAAYAAGPQFSEHFASRRRNDWSSAGEMYERFKDRSPYSLWQPQVLRDYCDYGVVPADDGDGFVLACPPEVEANIYTQSAGGNIYPAIDALDIPVRILRAKPRGEGDGGGDFLSSPTTPELVNEFAHATDVPHPELTHFIPMQAPGLVAQEVLALERQLAAHPKV